MIAMEYENLKRRLLRHSPTAVARECGVHVNTVQRIRCDPGYSPGIKVLIQIERGLLQMEERHESET